MLTPRRASPHILYSTLLGATGAEALPAPDLSEASSWAQLDAIGREVILNQLSTGRLPAEVALMYEVPILHFRSWLRARVDDDTLVEVRSAAAEALQVKAMLTLSANLANPAQASQAKALSERMARIAEALAPKEWAPSRIEAPGSLPSISISLDFGETPSRPQGVVISAEYDTTEQTPAAAAAVHELAGAEDGVLQAQSSPGAPSPSDDDYETHPPRLRPGEAQAREVLSLADPYLQVPLRVGRAMSEGM